MLNEHPLLNSHGLGQVRLPKATAQANGPGAWEMEIVPGDLNAARDELRAGGTHERGIRNTLEYLAEARVSLSYRLRGCGWARRFNGPAPRKRSSYALKHEVESYLHEMDQKNRQKNADTPQIDRYTTNGAFVCAALMAGLQMWVYRDSINPDFRLGKPWAVAGMQPQDFVRPADERMAEFWRWAVQHEVSDPAVESFIADTVYDLYEGADLNALKNSVEQGNGEARDVCVRLRIEFGIEVTGEFDSPRLGFMAGQMDVPEDFDRMGGSRIGEMFGAIG